MVPMVFPMGMMLSLLITNALLQYRTLRTLEAVLHLLRTSSAGDMEMARQGAEMGEPIARSDSS